MMPHHFHREKNTSYFGGCCTKIPIITLPLAVFSERHLGAGTQPTKFLRKKRFPLEFGNKYVGNQQQRMHKACQCKSVDQFLGFPLKNTLLF
jgi:hypothetical protein